jgi:hypothetical protein
MPSVLFRDGNRTVAAAIQTRMDNCCYAKPPFQGWQSDSCGSNLNVQSTTETDYYRVAKFPLQWTTVAMPSFLFRDGNRTVAVLATHTSAINT